MKTKHFARRCDFSSSQDRGKDLQEEYFKVLAATSTFDPSHVKRMRSKHEELDFWAQAASRLDEANVRCWPAYIGYQLSRLGKAYGPRPSVVFGPAAVRAWGEYVASPDLDAELAALRSSQHSIFSREQLAVKEMGEIANLSLTQNQINRRVLCDSTNALDSLFRYCMAYVFGYQRPIDLYKDEAVVLYSRYPEAYDRAWGELIVPPLSSTVKKYLEESNGS